MVTQTNEARYRQALDRTMELAANLSLAHEHLNLAKQAEDAVRGGKTAKALVRAQERAQETKRNTIGAARGTRNEAFERAAQVLEDAKLACAKAQKGANDAETVALQSAEANYGETIKVAQETNDSVMGEAQVAVHRAGREIVAIQDTIRQHNKVVRESLGIDLSSIVKV